MVEAEKLEQYGFDIAIYPSVGMAAACAALRDAYAYLQAKGSTSGCAVPAFNMQEMHELVGFPEVREFEKEYAE